MAKTFDRSVDMPSEPPNYCFTLIRDLCTQLDNIRGKKRICCRIRHQLTTLDHLICSAEDETLTDEGPCTRRLETVLHECLKTVTVVSKRRKISQAVLPCKNRLRNVELDLMQASSALLTAYTLHTNNKIASQNQEIAEQVRAAMLVVKNPSSNFLSGFPKFLKAPSEVEDVRVSYNGRGDVKICWSKSNSCTTDIVEFFQIMRDSSTDIFPNISGFCNEVDLFYDPIRNFKPFHKYTIRVRAVNSTGASEWSDEVVVCIKKAPPCRPRVTPKLVTLFSSTGTHRIDSARLMAPLPNDQELNGFPLEKLTVKYSKGTEHLLQSIEVYKFDDTRKEIMMEVTNLDLEKSEYSFAVVWSNEAGDSDHSDYLKVNMSDIVPGIPAQFWAVTSGGKTAGKSVTIHWTPPEYNAFAVSGYQLELFDHKTGVFNTYATTGPCQLSMIVEGLKRKREYVFRVCGIAVNGHRGNYTGPIVVVETKKQEN